METQTWRKGDIVGDGRFEILQELGAGGFGITYLAQDHVKKQRIAIKTLNSNQQREKDFAVRQKKFESEGFTLRGFRHPHIVRVYEKVEINGLLGFVMEYIPGQDLAKYVRAKGRLSEKESLLYINQISLALEYVHQDTFLHRDVNPRNIMLREDRPEAVLIDFGLAREFAELEPIYLSNTDGSELYKPVEQYEKRGVFGPQTDIYALAVTLYHLLNGAPLGSGKNWIAFTSIARKMNYERGLGEEADQELWAELINAGVSARTLSAIQAGMVIEPEDRPKNITKFRELLGLLPVATSLPEVPTLSFPEPLITSQPIQNSPAPSVEVVANPSPGLTASIPTKAKSTNHAQDLFKDVQDLLTSPVQTVVKTAKKKSISPGLTALISPPAKTTEDIKNKEEPVRSTSVQGDRSLSPKQKRLAALKRIKNSKKEEIRQSTEVQENRSSLPQSRPSPGFRMGGKESGIRMIRPLISRRLILQGFLGTGGLAGFGLIGLLLKKIFESQSTFKPVGSDLGSGGSVLFNTPVAIPKVDALKSINILTGLSEPVQAKGLKSYFQGRWRADPNFDGDLRYKVKVGRNGKIISLEGVDERSQIYLNKTGFLKPGETVSKNGQQDQKIWLILSSTGDIQTLADSNYQN